MANAQAAITIGELCAHFDLTLRTVRFYEEIKLLKPMRANKVRLYSEADRQRLAFIEEAKRLGFSLHNIADMLRDHGRSNSRQFPTIAPGLVQEQICYLERQRAELERKLKAARFLLETGVFEPDTP